MEGHHPVPEHLRRAGHLFDGQDREARIGERPGGPSRGDQLPTEIGQALGQIDDPGLVVYGKKGSQIAAFLVARLSITDRIAAG